MKIKIFQSMALLVFCIFITGCAEENTIGLNERVRHDDFFYSVSDVVKAPILSEGSNELVPEGIFYIVRVKIDNEAKKVTHKWDSSIAYLEDSSGNKYENNIPAQKVYYTSNLLPYSESFQLDAGKSSYTVFVFDVPKKISKIYLKFKGDFLMGDLLDGGKFTKTKVKLF